MITTVPTFSVSPLTERVDHYTVGEGKFGVTPYTPEKPYITTMGLYICKAIAIHNPATKRGLLAHLSYTYDLEKSIDTIVESFGPEIADADVQLVRTTEYRDPEWPVVDDIARAMARHDPQSIAIDLNPQSHRVRGVALNLAEGSLHELDFETMDQWSGAQSIALNQPIDPYS